MAMRTTDKAPGRRMGEREAKLAEALRANLRRRKAADRPAAAPDDPPPPDDKRS